MPRLNPEHTEKLIELINQSPYFQLLNMSLQEVDEGYCKVEMQLERKHLNAFGGIHGGAYASLLDTAAYWALYADLEEADGFTTLDLTSNNLRAIETGTLVAEGRVIKRGRSICLCEADIHDEQGQLMAHCISKQLVGPTLQPISAATATLGGAPLPPKFLDR